VSAVCGTVAPEFDPVAEAFAATLDGAAGGAALAVVVDDEPVVDLWGGDFVEDTLVLVFSGTKGVVATALLLLAERGELQLDEPVARYWPEFGAAGKGEIVVRHVLAHTAGVPGLKPPFPAEELLDQGALAERLAAEPAFWPPGTRIAYHGHTFGVICGELIRRIDGRSAGRFVAEEVAEPLGLEFWIGLQEELEPRVASLVAAPGYGFASYAEQPALPLEAIYGSGTLDWNDPLVHRAEIPSGNGIGSARALARLYGSPLLQGAPIEELSRGTCVVTGRPYAFGPGFELWTELGRLGPARDAFGHTGSGGSTHGAWPSLRTGFSYAPSELRSETGDDRGPAILRTVHACLTRAEAALR
jgi:CubicO group peptidase (beta-lactamase class C family)